MFWFLVYYMIDGFYMYLQSLDKEREMTKLKLKRIRRKLTEIRAKLLQVRIGKVKVSLVF